MLKAPVTRVDDEKTISTIKFKSLALKEEEGMELAIQPRLVGYYGQFETTTVG